MHHFVLLGWTWENETLSYLKQSHGVALTGKQRGMCALQSIVMTYNLTNLAAWYQIFMDDETVRESQFRKLDRVFENDVRLTYFSQPNASFGSSEVSNHARCMVHLESPHLEYKQPLKFSAGAKLDLYFSGCKITNKGFWGDDLYPGSKRIMGAS